MVATCEIGPVAIGEMSPARRAGEDG